MKRYKKAIYICKLSEFREWINHRIDEFIQLLSDSDDVDLMWDLVRNDWQDMKQQIGELPVLSDNDVKAYYNEWPEKAEELTKKIFVKILTT